MAVASSEERLRSAGMCVSVFAALNLPVRWRSATWLLQMRRGFFADFSPGGLFACHWVFFCFTSVCWKEALRGASQTLKGNVHV